MKRNLDSIFWGILLILVGGVALAHQMDYIDLEALSPMTWVWIFVGLGLVFLVRYLVSLKEWGWLFPTFFLEAIALTIWLAESGVREAYLGTPVMVAMALPFFVAFLLNMRQNWWALIPAFACSVVAVIITFADRMPGEWIGALVMYAVALPFFLVYLVNRSHRWALIPAFIVAAIGTLSLLSMASNWTGVIVMLAFSAPFFYVYFKQEGQWWALIPAGILASIAANVFLANPVFGKFAETTIPSAVQFLGWAATFHLLWRRRDTIPTAWARIPAMISAIVAAVLLVVAGFSETGLIVLLFLAGGVLIYMGLRPKKTTLPE